MAHAKPVAVNEYKIVDVKLDALTAPGIYQRPITKSKVDDMVENWDFMLYDPITVALRPNGTMAIVDGHHRVLAAIQLGMPTLPAKVETYRNHKEEAELFFKSNRKSIRMSSVDMFRARVVAEHEPFVSIDRMLRSTGHVIGAIKEGRGRKAVNCATKLETLWRSDSKALLTIWPIAVAMTAEGCRIEADLLVALHTVESQLVEGQSLASPIWVKRLTPEIAPELIKQYRIAKSSTDGRVSIAIMIIGYLNKGMRTNKLEINFK